LSGEIDALDAVSYALPRTKRKGYDVTFLPYTAYGIPDSPFLIFTATDSWAEINREVLPVFFEGLREGFRQVKTWTLHEWRAYTANLTGRSGEEEMEVWQATKPLIQVMGIEEGGTLFEHDLTAIEGLAELLFRHRLIQTRYSIPSIFREDYI
jgi:hypothetical protein